MRHSALRVLGALSCARSTHPRRWLATGVVPPTTPTTAPPPVTSVNTAATAVSLLSLVQCNTHVVAGASSGVTLPAPFFQSHALFSAECHYLWRSSYQFAGVAQALPSMGSHSTLELGEASVIVMRGKDMAVRALFNSCTHMAARLCPWSRTVKIADKIQCPLHHWIFDLQGEHRAPITPLTQSAKQRKNFALKRATIVQHKGALFVRMLPETDAESAPSVPAPMLDEWPEWLDLDAIPLVSTHISTVKANWKLLWTAPSSRWPSFVWRVSDDRSAAVLVQRWPVTPAVSAITRFHFAHAADNATNEFFAADNRRHAEQVAEAEGRQLQVDNGLTVPLGPHYFSALRDGLMLEAEKEAAYAMRRADLSAQAAAESAARSQVQ